MLQALPRAGYGLLWGKHSIYAPVADGKGDIGSSDTYRMGWMRAPVPFAATFKHLVVYSGEADSDTFLTFYKNAVDTTLSIVLPAGSTVAVDPLHSVTVQAGDDVVLVFGGTQQGSPGIHAGYCVECEADANFYALTSLTGSVAAGHGGWGGALGNGEVEAITSLASISGLYSHSYSINAVDGALTHICLKEIGSIATGGSWTGWYRIDGVLQDGTGGTVDTTTVLNDGDGFVVNEFNLPVAIQQRAEVVWIRNTTDAPFALSQMAVGIGFTPTTDGQFMLCGGSNNTILNTVTGYEWPQAGQQTTPETFAEAPSAYTGITATGLYVERTIQPGSGKSYVDTLRKNEAGTAITVTTADAAKTALITGQNVSYAYEDRMTLQIVPDGTPASSELHWGLAVTRTGLVRGVIGPYLVWRMGLHRPMTTAYRYFSDIDSPDPGSYYGGFKDGRIMSSGAGERRLSHFVTGDWTGSTFPLTVSDSDRLFRESLLSESGGRYFVNEVQQILMTTRANRAAQGAMYTVFAGLMTLQPTSTLQIDIELTDIVSQTILSDQGVVPWRKIGDGFLDQLLTVSESLDRETPEPIIYGQHRRVPDVDVASQFGFCVVPTYLGTMDVAGNNYHVWMVAGHACADIPTIRVDGDEVISDEGTEWFVPHHAGHTGLFDGNPYNDFRSSTYGNTRRYTLIFGKVTDLTADPNALTDPDACALGQKQLTVAVDGIEPEGDGSGAVIIDRIQQYKHFLINFVANRGPNSYQYGDWLANPVWNLFDGSVDIVDEDSFDAASAIAVERLPSAGSPATTAGYIGAAIIGSRSGERDSVKRWISEWNRSCGVWFGITHQGQISVVMLHPTQAIKDAAPLYEESNDILENSFSTNIGWPEHATRIPFQGDLNHATGAYLTQDVAIAQTAEANYGREIDGELRTYPMAPGITALYHLALMESRVCQHPPRIVTLQATIGPDAQADSLGYRDLGDYIRFRHFDAVSESASEIRLGIIVRHQVLSGDRAVLIDVMDVDHLIDFDAPATATVTPETVNDTCANAIDMGDLSTPYDETFDTTLNTTDESVSGSPAVFDGSGIAYHAAWFMVTPGTSGILHLATTDSDYDTQLVLFTGSCGGSPGFVQDAFNDNYGALKTSVIDRAVNEGETYHILVAGYGPDDCGFLRMFADLTAP